MFLALWIGTLQDGLSDDTSKLGKEVGIVVHRSVGAIIWSLILFAIVLISTASLYGLFLWVRREERRCASESSERDAVETVTDTEVRSKSCGDSASIESTSTLVDGKAEEVVYKSIV
jgi:hypothetical protein